MHYEKIWKKILNPNEDVKYEFSVGERYRKFYLWVLLIFGAGFLLLGIKSSMMAVATGIIFLVIAVVRFWYLKVSNAYAFTDRRVLIHHGWLSTKASSVDYSKITEVSVDEPFISRLFTKSGNLSIHTGNIADALILTNIATPYETKKKLDSLRHSQ